MTNLLKHFGQFNTPLVPQTTNIKNQYLLFNILILMLTILILKVKNVLWWTKINTG